MADELGLSAARGSSINKGAREITVKDLAAVEEWFGARGKFPAVHIPTGEIGV